MKTHAQSPAVWLARVSLIVIAGFAVLAAGPAAWAKTDPTLHWATPGAIRYGTALNGKVLDAWVSGGVAGTFVYTPAAGAVLGAGPHTLSVTFNPTDMADYNSVSTTVQLTVVKAVLLVAAYNVDPLHFPGLGTYGDPIPPLRYSITGFVNGEGMSAIGGAPVVTTTAVQGSPVGTYPITPALGTLAAANYSFAFQAGTLTVTPAPLFVSPYSRTQGYGDAIPAFKYSIIGFKNGETASVVTGAPSITTTAVKGSTPGAYPITATIGTLAAANYVFGFNAGTLTIVKYQAPIDWPAPAAIDYGTLLSYVQLDAKVNLPGTYAYTPGGATELGAGTHTLSVTFTPADTTDYSTATATVQLTVNKAEAPVAWPPPAAISYGTELSLTQLDASASVPGTWAYTPSAGTVLSVGAHTLSATFSPTDTADYLGATIETTLVVNKATPAIYWPTPAAIQAGTALSATQLDATASVPGTFAYTPAAGTVPPAGTDTLSVTFTPTDTADYTTATATVQLAVTQTTPTILWPAPAAITAGTALSATQLDATANVPGSFVYTPAAGTVLSAGMHTLSVTFTPTDTVSYSTVSASVKLAVTGAGFAATTTALSVSADSAPATTVDAGSVVTQTATVKAGSAPVTQGLVNFCDANAAHCTDIHIIGSGQLTDAGTAAIKFRPGGGSHRYRAEFAGTTADAASNSGSKGLTVTAPLVSATTMGVSGSAGNYSFTATVGGNGGATPTGTVSFLDTSNGNAVVASGPLVAQPAGLSFLTKPGLSGCTSCIVLADFNGDGILDAAVSGGDSVSVLLGDGSGLFNSASTVTMPGAGFYQIATADFNMDGIPDLVVCCSFGWGEVILLGNGDGTFTQPPVTVSARDVGTSVTTGDFNGDGIPDLAYGVEDLGPSGFVGIAFGKGDGTFSAGGGTKLSGSPGAVSVADFNGDGFADLALADCADFGCDDYQLFVQLGDGKGKFSTSFTFPTVPQYMAVGDFNGDGKPDLAMSVYGSDSLTILLGNGDGTFTPAPSPATGSAAQALTVGDFNGDGIADLAVVTTNGTTVLLGYGDGTFTALDTSLLPAGPGLLAADLNGDGLTDILGEYVFLPEKHTAAVNLTGLTVPGTGTHIVAASYPGDANYTASESQKYGLTAGSSAKPAGAKAEAYPKP